MNQLGNYVDDLIFDGPNSKPSIHLHQVLQPWIEKKKEEREMLLTLTPIILDHLQTSMNGNLSNIDGTPDTSIMRR